MRLRQKIALVDRTRKVPSDSRRRRTSNKATLAGTLTAKTRHARAKFRRYFPGGFYDPLYEDWERNYKWEAHQRWDASLGFKTFRNLLKAGEYAEIAHRVVSIESRTNLLFSFEKMALRDAVKTPSGAQAFSRGLYDYLHGSGIMEKRFEKWCHVVGKLPRRQTRVLTWPVVTVMGFLAQPKVHFFLKPTVTRLAAERYGFPLLYQSRPSWETYASVLAFARTVQRDLREMRPRDMIDIQSFLWVQGSDEYPE